MIEKQIILKNRLVNYYAVETDSRAARTVIFLHGWRANGMIWTPVVKLLAQRSFAGAQDDKNNEYNIYCLDLPGFGKSEFPQKPFHLKDYSEVVREFIEKLELLTLPSPLARGEGQRERSNIVVIGHSFGGRVAVKLAAEFPGIVEKLVLADCGGFRRAEWKRRLISFLAKVTKPAFALPLLQTLRPKIYNILGADDYLAIPELKNTFLNVINEDLLALASQIKVPTLILWGEKDQEVPLEFGQLIHREIPNSRFSILENAGHFSFLDKPEEFAGELSKFLRT